jgi:hypothetical protein
MPQSMTLIEELRSTKTFDGKMQELPWNTFIDAKHLFKFIYNLQILETLVSSCEKDPQVIISLTSVFVSLCFFRNFISV